MLKQRSKLHKGAMCCLCLCITILLYTESYAQSFNKTFTVQPETSLLQISGQYGSITVNSSASAGDKVIVKADQSTINAVKTPEGNIKVEVSGRNPVNIEITSPPSLNLDLLIYKGAISVNHSTGPIRARISTEGNILLSDIKSSKVEADSMRGNISFNGDVLANGHYTLKSVSGKIDMVLPANADFKLTAASFNNPIDFGGFKLNFEKQNKENIVATCGNGKADVALWTQDGSINLHKKK